MKNMMKTMGDIIIKEQLSTYRNYVKLIIDEIKKKFKYVTAVDNETGSKTIEELTDEQIFEIFENKIFTFGFTDSNNDDIFTKIIGIDTLIKEYDRIMCK